MCGRSALELGIPAPLVKDWGRALEAAHALGNPVITRTDRNPIPLGDLESCERLIREAGGTLRVEPFVGSGFRVRIGLPLLRLG